MWEGWEHARGLGGQAVALLAAEALGCRTMGWGRMRQLLGVCSSRAAWAVWWFSGLLADWLSTSYLLSAFVCFLP
jgi:hypothetical protein